MDAYEIDNTSYKKTEQNRIAAFGFNGVGVSAAVRPTTAKRRRNQYGFQNREKS